MFVYKCLGFYIWALPCQKETDNRREGCLTAYGYGSIKNWKAITLQLYLLADMKSYWYFRMKYKYDQAMLLRLHTEMEEVF